MLKKIIILLFMFISSILIAEDRYLSVGYFGEYGTHPGLEISLESLLFQNKSIDFLWSARVGGYNHYMSHTSIFAGGELGVRKNFKNGFHIHAMLGLNYLHKFLDSPIYEENSQGVITNIKDYGSSHIMPHFTFGFGHTFNKGSKNSFTIYVDTEIFGEYPYNSFMLPHYVLNIGVKKRL